ncbi:MAG: benzoyl-CoA reductase subunit D [Proteobacteria bacterium]|nr:benzoyl-CoA reductase subunit D [Pseudomonadota bacterium]
MTIAAGIDVGSGAIKVSIYETGPDGAETRHALVAERIRRRDPTVVTRESWELALKHAGMVAGDVAYVATTGDGENVPWATGHFYGMTTHARGALHLDPTARAVLDVGSLHARAMKMDPRSKVLKYRMTSQCASGTGQFVENIARYLGVPAEDVGARSLQATEPEMVSSICAVLAETDVINMVSRGIDTNDILKGIHMSMSLRFAKLLRSVGADGVVLITGGQSRDVGLLATLREALAKKAKNLQVEVRNHEQGIYAGAIGAALWGAWRHDYLARKEAS